jgi:hypothetical protein
VNRNHLMLFSLLLAGSAAAVQSGHYSATVAQPLSEGKVIVANGNIWRCSGTTCNLESEPKEPGSLRTCRELKRQVGALTAYGSTADSFDASKLSKCNGTG